MTRILTAVVGGAARICDEHCYRASGPRCTCVCGGRYHGAGLATAIGQADDDQRRLAGAELPEGVEAVQLAIPTT